MAHLSLLDCDIIEKIFCSFDLNDYVQLVADYRNNHILHYCETDVFYNLRVDEVVKLLTNDNINYVSERYALEAILEWIQRNEDEINPEDRVQEYEKMFNTVRFPLMLACE